MAAPKIHLVISYRVFYDTDPHQRTACGLGYYEGYHDYIENGVKWRPADGVVPTIAEVRKVTCRTCRGTGEFKLVESKAKAESMTARVWGIDDGQSMDIDRQAQEGR